MLLLLSCAWYTCTYLFQYGTSRSYSNTLTGFYYLDEYTAVQKPVRLFNINVEILASYLLYSITFSHVFFCQQDVTDDIQGAMNAGLMGYLVQTGKYSPGDENKIKPGPTAVFPSFVEAVNKILEQIKQTL